MTEQMSFSDEELRLLVNLLEQERDELPGEIHRTDNRDLHQELQQRRKLVDALYEKLSHTPVH